eukprot:TRINITY_DN10334_c0_g1_i1.p1 TRINITY_DN10334_c0_g1~~TRINITY_DN10334_c0_g1_i1.p1  ORF type:complete len:530 (-),score=33.02 TRINITY_DN10334_c0_g1_i1:183-1772(-)
MSADNSPPLRAWEDVPNRQSVSSDVAVPDEVNCVSVLMNSGWHLWQLIRRCLLISLPGFLIGILPIAYLGWDVGGSITADVGLEWLSAWWYNGSIFVYFQFWVLAYVMICGISFYLLTCIALLWKASEVSCRVICVEVVLFFMMFGCLCAFRALRFFEVMDSSTKDYLEFAVFGLWVVAAISFMFSVAPTTYRCRLLPMSVFLSCSLALSYFMYARVLWTFTVSNKSLPMVLAAFCWSSFLRIVMSEVILFVTIRLPQADVSLCAALLATTTGLSVACNHIACLSSFSLHATLIGQFISSLFEIIRAVGLLQGRSDFDRFWYVVCFCLRLLAWPFGVCSDAFCLSKVDVEPVSVVARVDENPVGDDIHRLKPNLALRAEVLAIMVSLTNQAELIALVFVPAFLALIKANQDRLGYPAPVSELFGYTFLMLLIELITDGFIVLASGYLAGRQAQYAVRCTAEVWATDYNTWKTQAIIGVALCLSIADSLTHLVMSYCFLDGVSFPCVMTEVTSFPQLLLLPLQHVIGLDP